MSEQEESAEERNYEVAILGASGWQLSVHAGRTSRFKFLATFITSRLPENRNQLTSLRFISTSNINNYI